MVYAQKKRKTDEEKEKEERIMGILRDNLPVMPTLGRDFPLTNKVKIHKAHHLFLPNILDSQSISLGGRRWGAFPKDITMMAMLDFILKAITNPCGSVKELIGKEMAEYYRKSDPTAKIRFLRKTDDKLDDIFEYNGCKFDYGGDVIYKYGVVVETLLKSEVIPAAVLQRYATGGADNEEDPLFYKKAELDPTSLNDLFDLSTSVGGFLISFLIYDPLMDLGTCIAKQVSLNHMTRNDFHNHLHTKEGLVSSFAGPTIERDIGFGNLKIDQNTGAVDPTSVMSGSADSATMHQVVNTISQNTDETGTVADAPTSVSSASLVTDIYSLLNFFSSYREHCTGVKSKSFEESVRPNWNASRTTKNKKVDPSFIKGKKAVKKNTVTIAVPTVEQASGSSSRDTTVQETVEIEAEEEEEHEDELAELTDDFFIESAGLMRARTNNQVFREETKMIKTNSTMEDLKISLIDPQELRNVLQRFNITYLQHADRVIHINNNNNYFKVPIPGCAYIMETPFPGVILSVVFPQELMKKKCNLDGIRDTYSNLYRAETLLSTDKLATLTKPENVISASGIPGRRLQPHEFVRAKLDKERLRYQMLLSSKDHVAAERGFQIFLGKVTREFKSIMEGKREVCGSMRAIYRHTKNMKRICTHLPHFEGFAPLSDAILNSYWLINQVGTDLVSYAEPVLSTAMGSFSMSLYQLDAGFKFPAYYVVISTGGAGKSRMFAVIFKSLILGTCAEWGTSSKMANYEHQHKDNFCVMISDEIPPIYIGKGGPGTEEQTAVIKNVLGDQKAVRDRVITDPFFHLHKIVKRVVQNFAGGMNDTVTPTHMRTNPVSTRFCAMVPSLNFIESFTPTHGSSDSATAMELKTITFDTFKDKQACIAHVHWYIEMGLMKAPMSDMTNMMVSRMLDNRDIFITTQNRDIGRVIYIAEQRSVEAAVHVVSNSWASPFLIWHKKNQPNKENVLETSIMASSMNMDPLLLLMCERVCSPSWDAPLAAITTVFFHNYVSSLRMLRYFLSLFGLKTLPYRERIRVYDQKLAFIKFRLEGGMILKKHAANTDVSTHLDQMRIIVDRRLAGPVTRSMLHWPTDKVSDKQWLPNDEGSTNIALESLKKINDALFSKEAHKKSNGGVDPVEEDEARRMYDNAESPMDYEENIDLPCDSPSPPPQKKFVDRYDHVATVDKWQSLVTFLGMNHDDPRMNIESTLKNDMSNYVPMDGDDEDRLIQLIYPDKNLTIQQKRTILYKLGLPQEPTTELERMRAPDNSRMVSLGIYTKGDKSKVGNFPWSVVGQENGEDLVDPNYWQITPGRHAGDIQVLISEFIKTHQKMAKDDKTPEIPFFVSSCKEIKMKLHGYNKKTPRSAAPSENDHIGKFFHYSTWSDEKDFVSTEIAKEVTAVPESLGTEESVKRLNTSSKANVQIVPDHNLQDMGNGTIMKGKKKVGDQSTLGFKAQLFNEGSSDSNMPPDQQQQQANNGPSKNFNISTIASLVYPEHMIEAYITLLTSKFTKRGRKVALPMASSQDPLVPMVVEIFPGNAHTSFINMNYICEEVLDAFKTISTPDITASKNATSKKRNREDAEEVLSRPIVIDDDVKMPFKTLPKMDEEDYFNKEHARRISGEDATAGSHPREYINYIETMEAKFGGKPTLFKLADDCNMNKSKSKRELEKARNGSGK